MEIDQILRKAVEDGASDIFVVAGLPLTFKVRGTQVRREAEDVRIGEEWTLIDHRLTDTIAAQGTPPGEGGVAIVRISGPECRGLMARVFAAQNGQRLAPRRLTFGHILDGDTVVDEAMAVLMPAPHSYTREDVA